MKKRFVVRGERARELAADFLASVPVDPPTLVTFEKYVPERTLAQNSTIHMWFGEIAAWSGQDREEVKEFFKLQPWWPTQLIMVGTDMREIPVSSKKLNREQFTEVMDEVHRWAVDHYEYGLRLTDPLPQDLRELAEFG